MEILGLIVLVVIVMIMFSNKSKNKKTTKSGGPMVMRSNNGFEGHLDFLEMHGFITPEERQAQRDLEKDIKENPQNYRTLTWDEFMAENKQKNKKDDHQT